MRGSSLGGTTAVSGATVIGVTEHTITGTVNNDTGAIALTFSPALPNNTSVVAAEVIADFERDPDTIPSFGFEVRIFQLVMPQDTAL